MILKVFKSSLPSVNYIFGNGKPAIFQNNKYTTGVEAEIQELENEIRLGHPHIYIDPADSEIDSEAATPAELLREQIRKEIIAEMAAATDPNNDRGSYTAPELKPANTADINDASGIGLAARLMNIPGLGK
jgi:hypothetical protein